MPEEKQVKDIIKRDMLIGEAATMHPDAIEIMTGYGLHCFSCGLVSFETIEQGCRGHGMSEQEIDKMVKELNELFV